MICAIHLAVFIAAVIADSLACAGSLAACMLGKCFTTDVAVMVYRVFILAGSHFHVTIVAGMVSVAVVMIAHIAFSAGMVTVVILVFVLMTNGGNGAAECTAGIFT